MFLVPKAQFSPKSYESRHNITTTILNCILLCLIFYKSTKKKDNEFENDNNLVVHREIKS